MGKFCILIAALPLAACGQSGSVPGPEGVTVGEARALGEAAQMLDARAAPSDAPSDTATGTASAE